MKTYLEKTDAELTYESERAGYRGFYNRVVKRAIDLVLSLILSVVVTPVILIAGIMIVIDDGLSGVLYAAARRIPRQAVSYNQTEDDAPRRR